MSLQIGYVICFPNATNKVNIIHWFLIKCKRITRNVLAAELYGMAHGFNIRAIIKAMLKKMLGSAIPPILCTDLKFLYNCLVKLEITQKKQLMVNVISLYQLYKRREITKVKWIYRHHNSAYFMIKTKLSLALKTLIITNCINISTTEWV